jgi:hypothetical protein
VLISHGALYEELNVDDVNIPSLGKMENLISYFTMKAHLVTENLKF